MVKNKPLRLLLAVAVAGIFVASGLLAMGVAGTSDQDQVPTPEEIGAYFLNSEMSPLDIDPAISKQQAEEIALDELMTGWDMPRGRGIEENVIIKSTTASFSGSRHGNEPRTVHGRPAWILAIHDLPVSLPCGIRARLSDAGDDHHGCDTHSPRYHVAIDAETGQILSTDLTGGGEMPEKWYEIFKQNPPPEDQPTRPPTPTPTPPPPPTPTE